MTSIVTVRHADHILILLEGMRLSPDGKTVVNTECVRLPGAPALVACRGVAALASFVANDTRELIFDDVMKHEPTRHLTEPIGNVFWQLAFLVLNSVFILEVFPR